MAGGASALCADRALRPEGRPSIPGAIKSGLSFCKRPLPKLTAESGWLSVPVPERLPEAEFNLRHYQQSSDIDIYVDINIISSCQRTETSLTNARFMCATHASAFRCSAPHERLRAASTKRFAIWS